MIDDSDLMYCPFCGSRGATVIGSKGEETTYYYIICANERCHVRTKNYPTRMEAKSVWNRRVNE